MLRLVLYNFPVFRLFVLVDRLLASLSVLPASTHEYIVVGAGSAGSVVAGKSPPSPPPRLDPSRMVTLTIRLNMGLDI